MESGLLLFRQAIRFAFYVNALTGCVDILRIGRYLLQIALKAPLETMARHPPFSAAESSASHPASSPGGKRLTAQDFLEGIPPDSMPAEIMSAAASAGADAAQRLELLVAKPTTLPDFASARGITPLMAAAACGNARGVEILSSHPLVNLARQDKDGWTALHYAAAYGHADCLRVLLSHYAPLHLPAADGKLPFDLVTEEKAADAFWENRDFLRHMRQRQPAHPKFQPSADPSPGPAATEPVSAPPAGAAAKPGTAPEKNELKEAFFRAVTNVGLEWKAAPGMAVGRALAKKIAAMAEKELAETYKIIRASQASFDWSAVFVEAACLGNIAAMRFLHNEMLFEQRTLNVALCAVVAAGDDRNAAHHLVIWGANPDASFEANAQFAGDSIRSAAFCLGRMGCFEEIVTWARDPLPKRDIATYRAALKKLPLTQLRKAREAVDIAGHRRDLHGCSTKKLRGIFKAAAQNQSIPHIMAAYAEGQKGYLLRGTVDFDKTDGGAAIAAALMNEQYTLARRLISHGYHLKDAPAGMQTDLRLAGSAAAKKFAEEHLSGKMTVEPVEDAGRAKRAELRILATGPFIGGARYGMF
jgi:hypothetical protein